MVESEAAEGKPVARYLEIELWLREQTRTGTPGAVLPSEAELAAQFGVSRMTARQAVQNLAQEGLVERRRGSGTYIAEKPHHRREGILASFTEDMRLRGMTASSTLLDASLRSASVAEIEALDLADDAKVVSIQRIRRGDGVPQSIERAVLPTSCAAVLAADLEHGSLHAALHAAGHTPMIAQSWISARMPTPGEARHLSLPGQREPLLVERRIIRDQDNLPVEFTESAYVASRYVIDATFRITDPPVRPAGR
ncbi:MAG: GntR family transcriptional regulator [Micrococcales bacterium]|nr:GntR family transcriptional regulator [Micrococcales bacterium]